MRFLTSRFALSSAIAAVVAFAPPAGAAIYRVGSGAGCTHASIQAAIGAAAVSDADDEIRLSATLAYAQQALLVDEARGSLVIAGGYSSCSDDAPAPAARTLVAGNGTLPVVRIHATPSVALYGLDIQGGYSQDYGGGIHVTGGEGDVLVLGHTLVRGNDANAGGGIAVRTVGPQIGAGSVQLLLFGDSAVLSNHASMGGGIYCENASVQLFDQAHVSLNAANGSGGGIHAEGCALRIGSRGLGGAVLWANSAGLGGGLSLRGLYASAEMYTVDPRVPARIVGNQAAEGGGVAVANDARLRLFDVNVEDNIASAAGGAMLVAYGSMADTRIEMQAALEGAPAAAVNCAEAERCNRVAGNRVVDGKGLRGPGAAIVVYAGAPHSAHARFRGTRFEANVGESLAHHAGDHGQLLFDGALVVGNDASGALFDAPGSANSLAVVATTVAANAIGAGRGVIAGSGACDVEDDVRGTYVSNGIVWQPGHALLQASSTPQPFCFRHLVANAFGALPASDERLVADPLFSDAAGGDFRLSLGSPALDFAPRTQSTFTRDRGPRVFDLPWRPDRFGPQDLGAYEYMPSLIFADGFERAGS